MTIRIDGTNTAANPGITGTDTDTGLQFGTDEVNIVTGGSTRATVDSNGNLGLGTTSIEANTNYNTLEIAGDTSSGGGIVRLKTGDRTTAKTMLFCDTGGFEARVETNHPFVISTNNSERLRVLAAGGLTFNGDTAAANALDDYEEGTWTPSLTNGGTVTVNSATYTKIGRLVTINFYINIGSVPSNSSQFEIADLPYTVQGSNWYGAGQISFANTKDVSVWRPLVNTNSNYIYFHRVDGSSVSGQNLNFTGITDLILSIWYFT